MSIQGNAALRRQILESYNELRPKAGEEYQAWTEAVAEELGVQQSTIRLTIAREASLWARTIQRHIDTNAQEVAKLLGAGVEVAIQTLLDGCKAELRKPLRSPDGGYITDREGNLCYYTYPAWDARVTAAKALIAIHGGNAPEQIDVRQQITIKDETEDSIIERLRQLRREIAEIEDAPDANGAGHRRVESAKGGSRSLLLDDGMHPNVG